MSNQIQLKEDVVKRHHLNVVEFKS